MATGRAIRFGLVIAVTLAMAAAAAAQPPRPARVGVVLFRSPDRDPNVATFRQALGAPGWQEGGNLRLEYASAEGRAERSPDLAAGLVAARPDPIHALGGDVVAALQRATRTIPVVMVVSNEPVAAGLVASLARPGGNITGLTFLLSDLAGKRLERLHEIAPRITRAAIRGAVLAHGPKIDDVIRRPAAHVDRVLRAAPATLPVEQPTTYQLVLNLRAARERGLTVPPSLLVRADRVTD